MFRGSGVRDTLRMSLLLCGGDCCLRWVDGDVLEESKRLWGLVDRLTGRPRFAGEGERRLADPIGDRVSLGGLAEGGLLLCLGGDTEEGGERLR